MEQDNNERLNMIHKVRILQPSAIVSAISLAIIFGAVSTAPIATAEQGSSIEQKTKTEIHIKTEQNTSTDDSSERSAAKKAALEAAKEQRKATEVENKLQRKAANEKLTASKLQICNDRKANIEQRVARISERVDKHLELFNNIAERAQAFYAAKGNTLPNYDALVENMNKKKTAAQTAADTLALQKNSFDCEGENPKAAITNYKNTLTDTQTALKDYRTSIKDLIVGIKSVNATQNDDAAATTKEN
jgi:uncharacterized protein YmfQ (DUF2313 family)